jgi:F420H(2)-dependent quinone reductase
MDPRPTYSHAGANPLRRYHNPRANPRTRVLFDGDEREMMARELEGNERDGWYERGIEIYPGWVQYRKRAPRRIPVIELTPQS